MRLFRFRTVTHDNLEYTTDVLERGRLYCSAPDELNDVLEGFRSTPAGSDQSWRDVAKSMRICSFTDVGSNMLMWAYYANGFKGAVLVVDFDETQLTVESGEQARLQKVEYRHDCTSAPLPANPREAAYASLAAKADYWKGEQEWRLIVPAVRLDAGRYFDGFELASVVLGHRMEPDLKAKLIELCSRYQIPSGTASPLLHAHDSKKFRGHPHRPIGIENHHTAPGQVPL